MNQESELSSGPKTFTVNSALLGEADLRLDASFYTQDVVIARKILESCRYPIVTLNDLSSDIFTLNRFRRIWMSDQSNAYSYLSASEILNFKPFRTRYVSTKTVERPELHFVKEGWILMTSSGTVGLPVLVGKSLTKYFLTHDLIRILPKQPELAGYLYAYLCTRVGKALVSKDQYGGVVDHIEAHHVKAIPVPKIPFEDIKGINEKVVKAWKLREQALQLEEEAIRDLEALLERGMDSKRT